MSFQALIHPFLHVFVIIIFFMSSPKLSLPFFLACSYAYMSGQMAGILDDSKDKLVNWVDGCIIDATTLMCTHQLLVNFLVKLANFSVYMGNDDDQQPRMLRLSNSNTIPQFNLLVHCMRIPRKVPAWIHSRLNKLPVSGVKHCDTDQVCRFILEEISGRHYDDNTARNRISENGLNFLLVQKHYENLVPASVRGSYESTVLLWHLATGILYHIDNPNKSSSSEYSSSKREMSMVLSDYMGFLLTVRPWVMSQQWGNTSIKVGDALSQIIDIIHSNDSVQGHQMWRTDLKALSQNILRICSTRKNLDRKRQTLHYLTKVVRSLSEMQQSLKTISQFLWCQCKCEQEKQLPSLGERDDYYNKYLQWKDYTECYLDRIEPMESVHRNVLQSLSEMQESLNKLWQIPSLPVWRKHCALSKGKSHEDEAKTWGFEHRQTPPWVEDLAKHETKFFDNINLIKHTIKQAKEPLVKMERCLILEPHAMEVLQSPHPVS